MFDPDAGMPRINRGMVYLGAFLIAGIRLARERQAKDCVVLKSSATLRFLRLLAGRSSRSGLSNLHCHAIKDVNRLKEILHNIHDRVNLGQLRRITPVGSSTASVKSRVQNLTVLRADEALHFQLLQLFCKPTNIAHLINNNHVEYGTSPHHR